MSMKKPDELPDDSDQQSTPGLPDASHGSEAPISTPTEITLRDGDSVTLEVGAESPTHLVVNVVPPQRSTGFLSSCLQGCGCLVIVMIVLAVIGSFIR